MPRGERSARRDAGFTYVALLAAVALAGLLLGTAAEVWATAERRDREAELLWVGHEYRAAIGRYWIQKRRYPQALEELLGAPGDAPAPVHYIRRLYPDPMSRGAPWTLVQAPGGGIMGVASASTRAPLKVAGFDLVDQDFEKAATYADWQFSFQLPASRRRPR